MQKHDGLILRGDKWYIQKTVSVGKRKRFVREATGISKEEIGQAIEFRDKRIMAVQKELIQASAPEHLFREAAADYVVSLERKGKTAEREIHALTDVDPYIGHLPLSHVHQDALFAYEKAKRGHVKSATIARTYTVVVSVLNYAARVKRDGNQPWLVTAVPRITAPDWSDMDKPYRLTWEEQDLLVGALQKPRRTHLLHPVLFALATGAREQEVVGLRWEWEREVEGMPKGSVWEIPAETRKANAMKTASEQQSRYLVCGHMARSIVDACRSNGSDFVFPSYKGGKMKRLNNHGWRSAWKESGFPRDGYLKGVHNLRHTFGERMESAGIPKEYRSAILGHSSSSVTDLYSAPGLMRMLEQVEKVTRKSVHLVRPVTQNTTQERKRAV